MGKRANSIFRTKSLERVQSPDQLDDYIHVASTKIWLIILGIIFLLLAFLVWGVTTTVEMNTKSESGQTVTQEVTPITFIVQ